MSNFETYSMDNHLRGGDEDVNQLWLWRNGWGLVWAMKPG